MSLPRSIWNLLGLLAGFVALSALVVAALAVLQRPAAAWFLALFEVVVFVAAVFGVLLARGRFRDGPAMALLCVCGTIGVGSVMGYLTTRQLMGTSLEMFVLARVGAAGLFGAAAAAEVLLRDPRKSMPMLFKGIMAGIPVLIIAAVVSRSSVLASISAMHPLTQLAVWVGGFVVVTVLGCASVHWLIRAFAVGVEKLEQSPTPGSAGAA